MIRGLTAASVAFGRGALTLLGYLLVIALAFATATALIAWISG